MKVTRWTIVGVAFMVAGCSGPSAYQRVFRDAQRANTHTYPVGIETCWLAINRAVLGLNFLVQTQDPERGVVQAVRHFQDGKRTTSVLLQVNVQPAGPEQTTVYATAVETTEKMFSRSHTRFFLWLIPLPGGGGTEVQRVKARERTIEDRKFYKKFFLAVEQDIHMLETIQSAPPAVESLHIPQSFVPIPGAL